jgi:hypothetical protein
MIAEHLRDGRLVAPFAKRYDSARGYYAIVAPAAGERPDVDAFVRWLADEAKEERAAMVDGAAAGAQRRARSPRRAPHRGAAA